jgi:hypothetical protein
MQPSARCQAPFGSPEDLDLLAIPAPPARCQAPFGSPADLDLLAIPATPTRCQAPVGSPEDLDLLAIPAPPARCQAPFGSPADLDLLAIPAPPARCQAPFGSPADLDLLAIPATPTRCQAPVGSPEDLDLLAIPTPPARCQAPVGSPEDLDLLAISAPPARCQAPVGSPEDLDLLAIPAPPARCQAPGYARAATAIFCFLLAFMATFGPKQAHAQAPLPASESLIPLAALKAKFEIDIQPILTARGCNSGPCHGKSRGQNGFALSLLGFDSEMDYRSIVTDARGRRVAPATPADSLLLLKATAQLPHGGGKKLQPDSPDYQTLLLWIESGFPRISESDPTLTQVSISPAPKPLAPGEELNLRVTASYSDGSTRDVTQTSAYQSNEPAVLAVKPDGTIRAGSLPGEATIMARYMGNIATWSSAIPRPDPVDPNTYAQLPRKNFIDDLVYQRLAHLNIVPSKPASDSQFLRRAYIDVIGRQPTSDEARDFLQDPNPEKRITLIDALLERPEYADNWANKWADLLRPNPYRVGIKAVLSLDTWIRDAFRQNLPYDQFVRGVLTARGSNWKNGAVTIFRDRREPDEIVTMASQLFLGIRLDCAKCHQHPFEVYGQHDFYSFAAFFSRVGFKGTGLSPPISGGEETVLVKSSGDVKHPLTGKALTPKILRGSEVPISEGDDPREKLVDWMVSDSNPTFAHVAVNRVWAELFGVGIVDPVDDLRATNPPSNPQLLDRLATHFRSIGFNQKELLKTILQSHTYALASEPNETNRGDHRNFSRHYRQRLRAEVLADAICDITETTQPYSGSPNGTRAMQLWTVRTESELLDAFGRPDPNQDPPCERIPESTVVQALHLMNAPAIASKITDENGRAKRLAVSEMPPEKILEELYLATFSRFPEATELSDLASEFGKPNNDRRKLVEDILWSMLNSPEFTHKD